MNLFKLATVFLLTESTILSRNKRDSIGQNRLGNNLRAYKDGKSRHSPSPSYSFQLLKWFDGSSEAKKLLKMIKMDSGHVRSNRLRNFRRYHRKI